LRNALRHDRSAEDVRITCGLAALRRADLDLNGMRQS
jgi:hypothetical protein